MYNIFFLTQGAINHTQEDLQVEIFNVLMHITHYIRAVEQEGTSVSLRERIPVCVILIPCCSGAGAVIQCLGAAVARVTREYSYGEFLSSQRPLICVEGKSEYI